VVFGTALVPLVESQILVLRADEYAACAGGCAAVQRVGQPIAGDRLTLYPQFRRYR
jgi:hypothetical protein